MTTSDKEDMDVRWKNDGKCEQNERIEEREETNVT